MKNVVMGINEDGLKSLSLEVIDSADRISEIFDKIDACMDKLSGCYQDSSSVKLLEYYNDFRENYSVIKGNIKSYSDDFIELIEKMRENDNYLISLFQNYTNDTYDKIKSIENEEV